MTTEADAITLEQEKAFVMSLTDALEATYEAWLDTHVAVMLDQHISPSVLLDGLREFTSTALLGTVLGAMSTPAADPLALLEKWLEALRRATHEVMTDLAQETLQ